MNIAKLNKAEVFTALYNASAFIGFVVSILNKPHIMTCQEAEKILTKQKVFDEFQGRILKFDLSVDEVDTWWYNRYNGQYLAEKLIARLHKCSVR